MQSNDELTSEINRLTAEREALRAEVAQYRQGAQSEADAADEARRALTKAREVLKQLMEAFDSEVWVCHQCGHEEDTTDMDSAIYLREFLAHQPAPAAKREHILYRDGDSIDCIPESILDRNGQVALAMCTVCGKAEFELDGPCEPAPAVKGEE